MSHVPTGFASITPYLHLKDAPGFLDFAARAFGGELRMNYQEEGRVVHAEISIAGTMVEVSEARPEWPSTQTALHMYVPDVDAAHARAVEAGAKELSPPMDQPYGERGSAVQDRWGNNWYIATVTDMETRLRG